MLQVSGVLYRWSTFARQWIWVTWQRPVTLQWMQRASGNGYTTALMFWPIQNIKIATVHGEKPGYVLCAAGQLHSPTINPSFGYPCMEIGLNIFTTTVDTMVIVRKHGKKQPEVIGSNYLCKSGINGILIQNSFAAADAARQAAIQASFGWGLARGTKDVGALSPDTGSESPKRRLRYKHVDILLGLQYSTSQNYHAGSFKKLCTCLQ